MVSSVPRRAANGVPLTATLIAIRVYTVVLACCVVCTTHGVKYRRV